MNVKKISLTALLCALAVILGYVESLIPAPIPIAGVKLGLGNAAVVTALYLLNEKYAWGISVMKVVLCAMLFGGFSQFLYSFSGAILSVLAQCIAKRTKIFSVPGVSSVGGLFHNIGQIFCAGIIIGKGAFYYTPILCVSGIIGGFLTGIIASIIIKRGGDAFGKR